MRRGSVKINNQWYERYTTKENDFVNIGVKQVPFKNLIRGQVTHIRSRGKTIRW